MKEIESRLSIQLKFFGISGFHSVYSKKKQRVRTMANQAIICSGCVHVNPYKYGIKITGDFTITDGNMYIF